MKCYKCGAEYDSDYRFCQECYDRFMESDPRDYTLIVNIDTAKEIRRKFDIGDTYLNQIQCNNCGQIIRSKNRHDYVECQCGGCAVDGGSWYCKRVGNNYTELSQPFNDVAD